MKCNTIDPEIFVCRIYIWKRFVSFNFCWSDKCRKLSTTENSSDSIYLKENVQIYGSLPQHD